MWHVNASTSLYSDIYMWLGVCVYACFMQICIMHVLICVYMCMHLYICVRDCICIMHMYENIDPETCIHTRIRTHTDAYF
jgi:hypothetical protein